MKFEIGWIAVVLSMVFFYVRMIQLRGRRRKEAREKELALMKSQAKRKGNQSPVPEKGERTDLSNRQLVFTGRRGGIDAAGFVTANTVHSPGGLLDVLVGGNLTWGGRIHIWFEIIVRQLHLYLIF